MSNIEAPKPAETETEKPEESPEAENELNVTFEPPKRSPPKLGQNRKTTPKKTSPKKESPKKVEQEPAEDEAPPPPKGAYNIDFDKFDDPSKSNAKNILASLEFNGQPDLTNIFFTARIRKILHRSSVDKLGNC